MSLWIAFTLAAALMQTARFTLQKQLGRTGLSTAGATFARFLFAAPFALAAAGAALALSGQALPPMPPAFWGFVLLGGVAQIVATDLTVALFQMRNFAVGVALTKTETLQVALFSVVILHEHVTAAGMGAIALGFAGVLLLSLGRGSGGREAGRVAARPVLFGLLAGALFGVASIGYRGATLALEPAPFLLRATLALAAATSVQTALMALWLAWREPGEAGRVLAGWRRTLPVGLTGLAGSLGWFAAFSLQNAAYVRALGQIEMVFTLAASALIFRERLGLREGAGIALIVGSVVALILLLA